MRGRAVLAESACFYLTLLPTGVAGQMHCCIYQWSLTPPFHPCLLPGGVFLWPYPAGYPTPGIPRYRALRSADFPRFATADRDHPINLGQIHHTFLVSWRQPGFSSDGSENIW